MARARSSLPEPLGPWMSTVLLLSAMLGSKLRIFWMCFILTDNIPHRVFLESSRRSVSMAERSRKVSAPPIIFPPRSRRTAALMLMGQGFSPVVQNVHG